MGCKCAGDWFFLFSTNTTSVKHCESVKQSIWSGRLVEHHSEFTFKLSLFSFVWSFKQVKIQIIIIKKNSDDFIALCLSEKACALFLAAALYCAGRDRYHTSSLQGWRAATNRKYIYSGINLCVVSARHAAQCLLVLPVCLLVWFFFFLRAAFTALLVEFHQC